jgi:hypothetical protein
MGFVMPERIHWSVSVIGLLWCESFATHPCKKRKDGAPSGLLVTHEIQGRATRRCESIASHPPQKAQEWGTLGVAGANEIQGQGLATRQRPSNLGQGETMKKAIAVSLVVLALAALACLTFAQTDSATIQRAANGVTHLRSMMKDPDSFTLQAAYLKKPNKQGISEVCYYYRAHNSFGGYSGTGEAVLLKNDNILIVDEETRASSFFGVFDPCKPKNRIADITAEVLGTLNPSQITVEQVKSRADRQKMIEAENAGFKKENVVGFAEIVGDSYIVHCERASSMRFHANMLNNKGYMAALQRAEILLLIYTNDTDQKFVFDMKTGQIVPPAPASDTKVIQQ